MFGYEAADTVLIEIGRRLDSCLRVSDLIGRLGGDRFGIALSHCPEPSISPRPPRRSWQRSARRRWRPRAGRSMRRCRSAAPSFPDQGLTSYDVITRAESALAEAKRAGRDCHYPLSHDRGAARAPAAQPVDQRTGPVGAARRAHRVRLPAGGRGDDRRSRSLRVPPAHAHAGRADHLRRRIRAGHRAARLYPADRPLRPRQGAGGAGRPSRSQARLQHFRPDGGRSAVAARADLAGSQPARHRLSPHRRDHRNRGALRYRGIGPVCQRAAPCRLPASRSTISAPAIPRCAICRAWPSIPSRSTARSSAISPAARTARFSCAICSDWRRGSASTPWPNASPPPKTPRSCGARASAFCRATISAGRRSNARGWLRRRPTRGR